MDNDLEDTQEKADTWKPHAWSEEEIVAAVAHLKRRIPQEWERLEHLERTTGELLDTREAICEFAELMDVYGGRFDHRDVIWLLGCVRRARRKDLGLD